MAKNVRANLQSKSSSDLDLVLLKDRNRILVISITGKSCFYSLLSCPTCEVAHRTLIVGAYKHLSLFHMSPSVTCQTKYQRIDETLIIL